MTLHAVADKYNIVGLGDIAPEKVTWTLKEMKIDLISHAPQFHSTVAAAYRYSEVTTNIHRALVARFIENRVLVCEYGVETYRELMRETPDFAMDVARYGVIWLTSGRAGVNWLGECCQITSCKASATQGMQL